MKKTFFIFIIHSFISVTAFAQASGEASVFQLASIDNTTYLIDTLGNTYNSWQCSARAASTAYLLKDGSILRPYRVSNPSMSAGATGGGIQIIDWYNNVTWEYLWSNNDHQQHHECIPIEQQDGTYHALLIAWERKTDSEVEQAGGGNNEMWPAEIIEIEPIGSSGGNVVWEWHAFDHLCQDTEPSKDNYYTDCNQYPELFDLGLYDGGHVNNQGNFIGDWIHANGMDYSPVLDQIVFSSHFLHEIYIIDRSTTTSEAASHTGGNAGKGGDILYRWGNPGNYGGSGSRELYTVHGANFIDPGYPGEGNLMCFDNEATTDGGNGNSRVLEITSPLNGSTYDMPWNQQTAWSYSDPGNFYANHLSGAFRLKNGNTMATLGTSTKWREVDSLGNVVYEYVFSGGGNMAKASVYELNYPGLIGVAPPASWDCLSPGNCEDPGTGLGAYLSLAECQDSCAATTINENTKELVSIFPNPVNDLVIISIQGESKEMAVIEISDITGRVMHAETLEKPYFTFNVSHLHAGVYFVKISTGQFEITKKLIKQ